MATLAELTTLRLGGPARELVVAEDETALVDALSADAIVVGGGSNLVVADAGVDARVVLVRTRGIEVDADGRVVVAAGEDWDEVVARCVAEGLAGLEALSGIPGSTGATPIQNVGAYGQDVAQTIAAVRVWDRRAGAERVLSRADCGFGYRDSVLKRDPEAFVVLDVTFALERSELGAPVGYAELATALGVSLGDRAPLAEVRDAVLALRRGKGMVSDAQDADSHSAGSFFTNPILDAGAFAGLGEGAPGWPEPDGRVKASAAWLIQNSGFHRGQGDPAGIAISSKHVLALTNRGAGTTTQLVALAREIAAGVEARFGVVLVPEPVFLGHEWNPTAL